MRLAIRGLAVAALVGYVVWNVFWLSHGSVPPSLFTYLTGLPCPTTGGTRSLRSLLSGDWVESLRFNAMTLPILGLLATTLALLLFRVWRDRRIGLPVWVLRAWLALLALAWLLKLFGPRAYW